MLDIFRLGDGGQPLRLPGTAESITWMSIAVPGEDRTIGARVFVPTGCHLGWLVWAHGGSWSGGSVEGWHLPCADLARAARCVVVSVDYRLAPANRHPDAINDVLAVLDWVAERAEGEGHGGNVAVGGDSAGATIAACAALSYRDRGGRLAAQVLAYPPVDPQCRAASFTRDPSAFPDRAHLVSAWAQYLGESTAPYRTPVDGDLAAAPATILAVGRLDPVIDDARLLRDRLRAAGVPVRYSEMPGVAHGAFLNPDAPLRDWLGANLAEQLAPAE